MQLQKPEFSGTIVSVKAGETIPETFLVKCLAENRSAIGFVVQDNGKLEVEKFGKADLADLDQAVKTVRSIVENTKKHNRFFVFQQNPEEHDENEAQPWIIIKDSKNNPIICVAIEGDFPGTSIDGDSEAMSLVGEYIGPKIEALYALVGNHPGKLYIAMKDKTFGADLLSQIGHRGHFVFMPVAGDVFGWSKENEAVRQDGDFAWGAASFTYGYTESAIAAGTAEPVPASQTLRKVSKYASAEPEPAKPEIKTDDNGIHTLPAKPVEVPKIVPPEPQTPEQKAAAAAVDGHWETPPTSVHGKNLKQWYRTMNAKNEGVTSDLGSLNSDWKKRPRVYIKHATTVKSLSELSNTAIGHSVKEPVIEQLPVISGPQQAAANAFIKKFLDGASNEIKNPLELQKEESKLAVFSELCLGGNLDRIERWATAGKLAFLKANPEAAWLLLNELILDRIKRKATMAIGDKKLGDLTGTAAPEIIPEPIKEPIAPSVEPAVHKPKKVSKYG